MGKRKRRERDRPKAAPDAAYNPNKRVLLSYADDGDDDDEEEEEAQPDVPNATQPAAGARASIPLDDADIANYQIPEYPDEDDIEENAGVSKRYEAPNQDVREGSSKGGRGSTRRKDLTTNQHFALGYHRDEYDEDDAYDSTTEDAMQYLRAVRSERQTIPGILSAPSLPGPAAAQSDCAHTDVSYVDRDEAFIGLPTGDDDNGDPTNPQFAFDQALKQRFLALREHFLMDGVEDETPPPLPEFNNKGYAEWYRLLASRAPLLAHMRTVDHETSIYLLDMIQKHLLVQGKNINQATSAWIWALLARLDEVGNMTNDQVYPLRELGKHVLLLQMSTLDLSSQDAAELQALGQGDHRPSPAHEIETDHTPNGEEIKIDHCDAAERTAKGAAERIPEKNDLGSISGNTKATLDVILVVVGELYGQRDLLQYRQAWTPIQE